MILNPLCRTPGIAYGQRADAEPDWFLLHAYAHVPLTENIFFFFILKRNEWKIVWERETNRSITSCVCVYEFFFLDSIW